MQSKVLITGAAGFIGSHTTDRLLSMGHEVIGVDDLSTGSIRNLADARTHDGFEFVKKDVLAPDVLNHLCETFRPDAIIHLAGLVSVTKAEEEPWLNFRLNIEATQVICETAREWGVKRVVFSSSAATYGDNTEQPLRETTLTHPLSLYGAAKQASEILIGAYENCFGLETMCLRYFNVYGPRQDPRSPYSGVISIFTDRFARGLPVTVYGDGFQTRDFVSVRDVARANSLAATGSSVSSSLPVNICTGKSRSLNELLDILENLYPDAPDREYRDARPGEIIHSAGVSDRAAHVLGFEAEIPLEEGIRELIQPAATDPSLAQILNLHRDSTPN